MGFVFKFCCYFVKGVFVFVIVVGIVVCELIVFGGGFLINIMVLVFVVFLVFKIFEVVGDVIFV